MIRRTNHVDNKHLSSAAYSSRLSPRGCLIDTCWMPGAECEWLRKLFLDIRIWFSFCQILTKDNPWEKTKIMIYLPLKTDKIFMTNFTGVALHFGAPCVCATAVCDLMPLSWTFNNKSNIFLLCFFCCIQTHWFSWNIHLLLTAGLCVNKHKVVWHTLGTIENQSHSNF